MSTCPQCGATFPHDQRCRDRFDADQTREFEQPAYFAVHQLSAPCYLLQHNGYSRAGWLWAHSLLAQFVAGLSPAEARQQQRGAVDSVRRSCSFTKGARLPGVAAIAWTRTIADVRTDTPEHYRADVRAWAASILADTAPLLRTLDPTP